MRPCTSWGELLWISGKGGSFNADGAVMLQLFCTGGRRGLLGVGEVSKFSILSQPYISQISFDAGNSLWSKTVNTTFVRR